ncbi:MAG TPA: AAA family ATPase [Gemmatimonadaceae bacterium]|nr:AAA family ATPase [Gemmatimonadaceae bacterium]
MTALTTLKQQLAEIAEAPRPERRGLVTGVEALDAALQSGGVPRGRLTEVVGQRGSGKTTFLRGLVEETAKQGLWVAYVDAGRTLAPRDWAHVSGSDGEGVWMVRPPEASKGVWCADVLIRSGAFALVVLDGAPRLSRAVAVRLTRLARDAGTALVVVGDDDASVSAVGGAVKLRVARAWRVTRGAWRVRSPEGRLPRVGEKPADDRASHSLESFRATHHARRATRSFSITIQKGGRAGSRQTVEVSYGVAVARRLCADPEIPDRRGVQRPSAKTPRGTGASSHSPPRATRDAPRASDRVLPRKRRCAEPDFGRASRTASSAASARRAAGVNTGTLG